MTREEWIGHYCPKCDTRMKAGIKYCGCMDRMLDAETQKHRLDHWLPCYVRVSVSMASANK